MSTLHDRLVDLATGAPEAGAAAPGLWERGLRYRRRRRAGSLVVVLAAVVAIAGLGSVTWSRSPSAVEPLPASSPVRLPDRLYDVSPWLPGTADAGALGPLAAVVPTSRASWGGQAPALAGVSAQTGEYRFLDLPGLLPGSAALAPDGRHVAYAYADEDRPDLVADGVAVYDPATAEIRRHALPGALGVTVTDLLWAGSDTLLVGWAVVIDSPAGSVATAAKSPLTWPVGQDAPTPLPTNHELVSAGPGVAVLRNEGNRFYLVDSRTGAEKASFVLRGASFFLVVDASGARLAVRGGSGIPEQLLVGATASVPVEVVTVGERRVFALWGWVDDHRLAALWRRGLDAPYADAALVDADTGAVEVVVGRVPFDAQVATDLLPQPTVPAVRPADPVDPRLVTGLGAGVVLVAALALLVWWRRVQP